MRRHTAVRGIAAVGAGCLASGILAITPAATAATASIRVLPEGTYRSGSIGWTVEVVCPAGTTAYAVGGVSQGGGDGEDVERISCTGAPQRVCLESGVVFGEGVTFHPGRASALADLEYVDGEDYRSIDSGRQSIIARPVR